MANTFTSYPATNVGTTPVTLLTVASATQCTVIGTTIANTTTQTIKGSLYVTRGGTNYYIVKNANIASGGSLVPIGGDQKIVLIAGDTLNVVTDTATSADVFASVLNIT